MFCASIACGNVPAPSKGTVQIIAVSPTSVTINGVSVSITGPNISAAISHALGATGGTNQFSGTFADVPVGANHFAATATDSASVSYSGSANATVNANATITVTIVLTPTTTQPGFTNTAPKISAATVSPGNPQVGQVVTVAVTASDPDGDTLTYNATSTCGSNPAAVSGVPGSFTWTAALPTTGTTCTIVVNVSDGTNSDQISIVITVGPGQGTAVVNATVDPAPVITAITTSPAYVVAGGQNALAVTATDWSLSNTLTYTWSVNTSACPGSFSVNGTTTAANTTFTPSAAPTASCVFTVVVSDQNGSASQGSLTVSGTGPAVAIFAPVIDTSFVDKTGLFLGAVATMQVTAHDPNSPPQTLSFTWTSSFGTLGTPNSTSGSSTETLTATQCPPGTATVTVKNTSNLTATQVFSFTNGC